MASTTFRYTSTHVYFLGSYFSQWARTAFDAPLPVLENGKLVSTPETLKFSCTEQYMMASKAILFDDADALARIMTTNNPADHKRFGRGVQNFDVSVWNTHARDIVYLGNFYKFAQHTDSKLFMDSMGQRVFVEGADYDPVWGVKINWEDASIEDESNWQGTNWLGECLMRVRDDLAAHGSDSNPFDHIRGW